MRLTNRASQLRNLLVAALALGAMGPAIADPPPITDLSALFCLRITDIEQTGGDDYDITFEVLNWTDTDATGLYMAMADPLVGSPGLQPGGPVISGISVKPAGRGPVGEFIDASISDSGVAAGRGGLGVHHSGRGRDDAPGLLNDWSEATSTSTTAMWDGTGGTAVPNRDLLNAFSTGGLPAAQALVPGFGFDQVFDSAIDGGPGPYFNGSPNEAGEPTPLGSGNVLDGFVVSISDLDFSEVFALNWFLLDSNGNPIGVPGSGNNYGFGIINLTADFNVLEAAGVAAGTAGGGGLLDPVFIGNTGFSQSQAVGLGEAFEFFNGGNIYGELAGGLTAPFISPADNIYGVTPNTQPIPEPAAIVLLTLGGVAALGALRRG